MMLTWRSRRMQLSKWWKTLGRKLCRGNQPNKRSLYFTIIIDYISYRYLSDTCCVHVKWTMSMYERKGILLQLWRSERHGRKVGRDENRLEICVCPRKPLNPKLIHVQKRRRRHLEGVHRPRFAQGVSWSSILSTWVLYFDAFQQLAFRWGEWKIKCVSPVVGIDGKNPKSRAVPGGFTSTCGQEPASSMGQTTKATALTLEDQSGLFQTWGS